MDISGPNPSVKIIFPDTPNFCIAALVDSERNSESFKLSSATS